VTSPDDEVAESVAKSSAPLVVPAVTEPRRSTIERPPSRMVAERRQTPWIPPRPDVGDDDDDDDSDVEDEVVTKLVKNETMREGARSYIIVV